MIIRIKYGHAEHTEDQKRIDNNNEETGDGTANRFGYITKSELWYLKKTHQEFKPLNHHTMPHSITQTNRR